MKKALVVISSIVIIVACNNGSSTKDKQDTTPPLSQTNNSVDILVDTLGFHTDSASAKYEKGSELMAKSDCLACHKVKEKLVGPAYTAVAEKYPATEENINYLSDKIIKGGKGVWGEIPMTPHPAISKADAAAMARYVLSLKGVK
ncbi:MAG: c-type cytochrome [Segetibacter sp.]|jgi:cytochrome c|nr:c-type cytochrome [Segetibacter sp.]